MFDAMTESIREETTRLMLTVQIRAAGGCRAKADAPPSRRRHVGGDTKPEPKVIAESEKVGRNDPCPCGSGKKYKKCCGADK